MARTKASKSSSRKNRSAGERTAAPAPQSTRARRTPAQDKAEASLSSQSFSRARDFVEANANLQTAGIALAGAGILALVSTQAGRSLLKTATDAVVNVVSQRYQQFAGQEDESTDTNTNQRPSRQRDQARI